MSPFTQGGLSGTDVPIYTIWLDRVFTAYPCKGNRRRCRLKDCYPNNFALRNGNNFQLIRRPVGAAYRNDVARLVTHERGAYGRLARNAVFHYVYVGDAGYRVSFLVAEFLVLDGDFAVEMDVGIIGNLCDNNRIFNLILEFGNLALVGALLLPRRVVFGVLRKVAVAPRLGNALDNLGAFFLYEVVEFLFYPNNFALRNGNNFQLIRRPVGAAYRNDVARLVTHERGAYGRLARNAVFHYVYVGDAGYRVSFLVAEFLVLDGDFAVEMDVGIIGNLCDNNRIFNLILEFGNLALVGALLLPRRVVFGVLRKVAVAPRLGNALDNLGAFFLYEVVEFLF